MAGCFVLCMLMGHPFSLFALIFTLDGGCIMVLTNLV